MPQVHAVPARPFRRLIGYGPPLIGGSLALTVLLAAPAFAAQAPVGLGTADSFAVLAGSGITNTGPTTITGDVGTFPTTSETGFGSVTLTGTNHDGDAVTQGAKPDLTTAYNDAAGRSPVTNVPVELGGTTLKAGVYTSPTLGLTGTLTLNAQGNPNAQFIFQAGSTLITATNSHVVLINGAQACNVVWQVGSSATFDAGTEFVGNVLAHTSITAQTASTFQGRLLARTGAVTLDTNTITRATCATVVTPTPTPSPTASTTPTSSPTPKPTHSVGTPKPTSPKPSPSATHGSPGGGGPKSPGGGHPGGKHPGGTTPTGGTPGGQTAARPSLPFTGLPAVALVGSGLALIGVGILGIVGAQWTRRKRQI